MVETTEALLHKEGDLFVWEGGFNTRALPGEAGFTWNGLLFKKWATNSPMVASLLSEHAGDELRAELAPWKEKIDKKLFLTFEGGFFVWNGFRKDSEVVRAAGFIWTGLVLNKWATDDPGKAMVLYDYADEKAKTALAGAKEATEASRAHDADIEVPVGDGALELGFNYLPYQRAAVAFMTSIDPVNKAAIAGDSMGLGKTVETIGALNVLGCEKILVACPSKAKYGWKLDLGNWLSKGLKLFVAEGTGGDIPSWADVVIINYDIIHSPKNYGALVAREWDAIVLDELHRLMNTNAKRTATIWGRKERKTNKKGKEVIIPEIIGLITRAEWKFGLTGTLIRNRPIEAWAPLNGLQPGKWGSRHSFGIKYANAHHNGYGWDYTGSSNLDALRTRLRASVMIRRTKDEVMPELPKKRRQVIELPPNGASRMLKTEAAAWSAHETKLESLRAEAELAHASGDEAAYKSAVEKLREGSRVAFEEMSAIRRDLAIAKVPAVIDYILETLEETEKVGVFAHHRAVVKAIMEALEEKGIGAVKIWGGMTAKEGDDAKNTFNTDPNARVFVGNIVAAGEAISLTGCSTVIFAELSWVPGEMTQAEDRFHGIGRGDHSADYLMIYHLVFNDSLDSKLAKTLVFKQGVFDRMLDSGGKVELPDMEVPTIPKGKRTTPKTYPKVSEEVRLAAHGAVRLMTAMDTDRASHPNGVGWNKIDGRVGHELAGVDVLTDGQVWLARKVLRKYRNTQLDAEVAELLWPEKEEK
jgi:hypothetical protein